MKYRGDVVGSLLRPAYLIAARKPHEDGELDEASFKGIEDRAAAYYDPARSSGAYATRDAYLADLVDLTRREIEELVRLGCRYIQIDAPQYAALLDEKMREGYCQRGSDPDEMIDRTIELDNAV